MAENWELTTGGSLELWTGAMRADLRVAHLAGSTGRRMAGLKEQRMGAMRAGLLAARSVGLMESC